MDNRKIATAAFQRFVRSNGLVNVDLKEMNNKISFRGLISWGRLLGVVLISSVLLSCEKEEEFKIPVEVAFHVDIHRTTDAASRLQVTEGHMVLSSFEFEGFREQADGVRFEKEYDKGLLIPFSADQPVDKLRFQIPQGVYNRINVTVETTDGEDNDKDDEKDEDDEEDETAGIVIRGHYRSEGGVQYPFVFEFESSEKFSIRARSRTDGDLVILKKEAPAAAHIKLNPEYWFQAVPLSLLENADKVTVGGVRTILINEEVNEKIYDILEERVGKSAGVLFVY